MAAIATIPGSGTVSNVKATIWTVPAGKKQVIVAVDFFNTDASTQTVKVYRKLGGTSRECRQCVLDQNETFVTLAKGEKWIMNGGDLIEAESTTNAVVNYTIDVVEES